MTTSPQFTRLLELLKAQPAGPGVSFEDLRASHEAAHASRPVAEDVIVAHVDAGGVPAELSTAPGVRPDRTLVYLHGGGYVLGSLATARGFAAELSRACGASVLSVDYRLAPEATHPAALDDATAAWRWLLEQGVDPGGTALCGDSAGGGLAVALMVAARDAGLPLPAACVCLSPWTDLTMQGGSYDTNREHDPQVDRSMLTEMALAYAAGEDLASPALSPVYADLTGLPPLLVQIGDAEAMLDDARAFAERATNCGVDATLQVWPAMIHVWQVYAPKLPEARDAVAEIGRWLQSIWDRGERSVAP